MKVFGCCIFLLCFFSSCVEEFRLKPSRASVEKQLVIQGRIAAGDKSIIYVSYSQPLGEYKQAEKVLDAQVRIVGQNGYQGVLAEYDEENGCYWIDSKELPDDTMYALQVEVNNESYQSEYLSLLDTPEIENVTYKEHGDGISIHVQTKGCENSSSHYMWSYEEDWESHASVDITKIPEDLCWYEPEIYPIPFSDEYNPYYYCWGHSVSSDILIYSTETLQENVLDIELLRIPVYDVRISYIYSVLVKQFSLSDEAYHYYRTLEKLSEENSGLFAPMPSELKGNVTCISNPNIPVQGYVLAANIQSKRIYIYESDFKEIVSEYNTLGCLWEKPDLSDENWRWKWIDLIDSGALVVAKYGKWQPYENPAHFMNSVLYRRPCVDCRLGDRATKKRPDFWPTNHE